MAEEPLTSAASVLKESGMDISMTLEQTQIEVGSHPVQEMLRVSMEPQELKAVPPGKREEFQSLEPPQPQPVPLSLTVDEAALHEVVKRAIAEALETNRALNHPSLPQNIRSVNSSMDSVDAPSAVSRFNLLASRMDMLESLLISGLQRDERREREEDWNDTDSRFAALESRLEAIEFRMEEIEASRERELTVVQNGREVELTAVVMDLTHRLSELEHAVGTEHEFSLKLLDLLLNQQQQASSQSLASSRGGTATGNGTVTSGSESGGKRRGSSTSARSRV